MGMLKLLFGFSDKCSNCQTEVTTSAAFCPECGQRMPRAKIVCPACGKELKGSAKFCSGCRAPVMPKPEAVAAVDSLNRWKRVPDEFARRIEAGDLPSLLRPGLVVEPDTQALIFQAGALTTTLSGGTFDLTRPPPGVDVAVPATAILMDAGETRLSLLYSALRTREDVPVDVILELAVRLIDPAAVYKNLMHGRECLVLAALAELLWSASANVVQARLRDAAVNELDGNLSWKAGLEQELRTQIGSVLSRNGLELADLRFVDVKSEMYEKIRQRRAETFLAEQKVDDMERRAALNQRLRETLTKDRMDQFTTSKDFEQFVRQTEHELGMKEVVRQAEMEELKQTYDNQREDAELTRRHLLEKLDLEHDLAVRRLRWSGAKEELEHQLDQQRQALEAQQQAEWSRFQRELEKRGALRQEQLKDVDAHAQEIRTKMSLADEALGLRKKRAEQEHEEEAARIRREQDEKDREAKRRLEEKDQSARHELDKIRALSDVEQARLAVDLQKTEILKGMSEDQILAAMAGNSPHVAAALVERARAQAQGQSGASAEVKALYEKLLQEKDSQRTSEADRLERMMARAMEAVERVAVGGVSREREQREEVKGVLDRSMDRMADVAVAKAGAPATSGSAASPATPAQVVCPDCHRQSPAGIKFCENCGHQFFK